ncbi:general odorant-binding protein 84a [Bactrocera dorsalis]|uniref:Odorant-binding protein n=1 Tax=Bactrocera dorsalis TaxID=27457 RepID=A0A6M9TZ42_BACDO|nr:general odorant-binding protein 84a [Bactrocera dorsalis]QKN21336.1 odorant-binding protein [Bactrocera dorsalis]
MINHRLLILALSLVLLGFLAGTRAHPETDATNNKLDKQQSMEMTTPTAGAANETGFDFEEVVRTCNASYTIPLEYIQQFNETAELPNITDKTGMCFLKCYMEKTGLLRDWQLNPTLIRQTMWPATGDSLPVCQNEGSRETCPCKRTYAIAKCLTLRALVDARNKPLV